MKQLTKKEKEAYSIVQSIRATQGYLKSGKTKKERHEEMVRRGKLAAVKRWPDKFDK